ncbi:MAG: hypothetical protein QXG78_02135 [Candidatus Methanomethyliaceae archaeon]
MSKKTLRLSAILLLILFLGNLGLVYGQQQEWPIHELPPESSLLQGRTLGDVLLQIFTWVLRILMWAAGAFAVIYIIWGGIQVIIQAKIDEGKNRLIYGAAGLAIALLAWAVVKFVESVVIQGQVGI